MVKKKGKSKRTTLKDKYKIQKRTIQTHRKQRKQAKKDATEGKIVNKKSKDPGIPNSWPFKADLLKEIQRTRERQQRVQEEQKEKRQEELRALRHHQEAGGKARSVEEMLQLAAQAQHDFDSKQEALASDDTEAKPDGSSHLLGQSSRRAYLRELKKVVDTADVLLQVLDARDPVGTRISPAVENAILSRTDKRMVLVLNKIDLVPKEVIGSWLTYLRKSHPTIALQANRMTKASTKAKPDADDVTVTTKDAASTISGMEGLLQLLKNYARTSGSTKTNIVVGVIGFPNTGKSSILKSLTHCRGSSANIGVSPRPGFTTCLQEVVLDRQVRLLDSPGVVFDDSSALLGNCVDVESMKDPIAGVEALLKRCSHKSLLLTYNLPNFIPGNVDMFLAIMAKQQGRVVKGGIPDKSAAARNVLKDWNSGKIPFYTTPPMENEKTRQDTVASAVIVTHLADDFLQKLDEQVLSGLSEEMANDTLDFVELSAPERRPDSNFDHSDVWSEMVSAEDAMEVELTTQQQLEGSRDYSFDDMM